MAHDRNLASKGQRHADFVVRGHVNGPGASEPVSAGDALEIWRLPEPDGNAPMTSGLPVGPDRKQLLELLARRKHVEYTLHDIGSDAISDQLELATGLLARNRREMQLESMPDEECDPIDLVFWLLSLKPVVAASAWRTYRNAIRELVPLRPHDNRDLALAMLAHDVNRRRARASQAIHVRKPHLDVLRRAFPGLRCGRNDIDGLVTTLVATGLEPAELATTLIETQAGVRGTSQDRVWLHVGMAAVGAEVYFRTLDVSGLDGSTLEAVRETIENAQLWAREKRFEKTVAACDRAFSRLSGEVLPLATRNISLGTLQHQFVANMSGCYDEAELTALLGFDPTNILLRQRTLKRRTRWARDEIPGYPVPSASTVQRFRKTFALCKQRMLIKRTRRELKAEGRLRGR